MTYFYKNISKTRNVTFIFQNFQIRKKNWKNLYRFWKIKKFIWNDKKDRSPDYWWVIFFGSLLINVQHCYYYIFDFFNMVDFFPDFCYIAKYWNFDRKKLLTKCIHKASLNSLKHSVSYMIHRFFKSVYLLYLKSILKYCICFLHE